MLLLSLPANTASAADDVPLQLAVTAPAGQTTDRAPAPRFQPVGNGDAITSPVLPDDRAETRSSLGSGGWWRIVFGATVVVVVLVALIQRRQEPDQRRGSGPGRGGRPHDRNVLGH